MRKKLILAFVVFFGFILPASALEKDVIKEKFLKVQKIETETNVIAPYIKYNDSNVEMNGHILSAVEFQEYLVKKSEIDTRLNLTKKQRIKARKIGTKVRKKISPVAIKLKMKQYEFEEMKNVGHTYITYEKANNDIKKLYEKMHKIRMKNMKKFEKILSKGQKCEFNKIREESLKARQARFN